MKEGNKKRRGLLSARRNTVARARCFVVGSDRPSEIFMPRGKNKITVTCN